MTMTYAGPCYYYYMLEMCRNVRRPIATVASLLWLRQVGREKPLICKTAFGGYTLRRDPLRTGLEKRRGGGAEIGAADPSSSLVN